jgi:hypothetical protein
MPDLNVPSAILIGGFPAGRVCDVGPYAPTGEPFTTLSMGGYQSLSDAEAGAHRTFDSYAAGCEGKLYWRAVPTAERHSDCWSFYMRLLISNKEVSHARS